MTTVAEMRSRREGRENLTPSPVLRTGSIWDALLHCEPFHHDSWTNICVCLGGKDTTVSYTSHHDTKAPWRKFPKAFHRQRRLQPLRRTRNISRRDFDDETLSTRVSMANHLRENQTRVFVQPETPPEVPQPPADTQNLKTKVVISGKRLRQLLRRLSVLERIQRFLSKLKARLNFYRRNWNFRRERIDLDDCIIDDTNSIVLENVPIETADTRCSECCDVLALVQSACEGEKSVTATVYETSNDEVLMVVESRNDEGDGRDDASKTVSIRMRADQFDQVIKGLGDSGEDDDQDDDEHESSTISHISVYTNQDTLTIRSAADEDPWWMPSFMDEAFATNIEIKVGTLEPSRSWDVSDPSSGKNWRRSVKRHGSWME